MMTPPVNDRSTRIGDVAEILLDYVEQKTTYQAQSIAHVRTSTYTDPDQWKAEMELVFRRVPLMLAFSAELPEPGE
jgi:hypothetical protein